MILLWIDLISNRVRFTPDSLKYLIYYLISYCSLNFVHTVIYKPVYTILRWYRLQDFIIVAQIIGLPILHFFIGKFTKEKIKNYFMR